MANTLQLKNDIKKLKGALASKNLSASIKNKLKTQLQKAENELKASKSGAPARKVSTTKSTRATLASLKNQIKKRGYGVYKNAGVDLKKDAEEPALKSGIRYSKGLKANQYGTKKQNKGNKYYEYRANRIDVKQPSKTARYPKLEKGGYMAKGGQAKKMYYHILEYGNYDEIGYQGYYDTLGEAEKEVKHLEGLFPNQSFEIFASDSINEPPIVTMADGGMMAKGGKVKEPMVVRGYFEDEAYEYAQGGNVDINKVLTKYATQDVNLLQKEGGMAITNTKMGVIFGEHKLGKFEFTNRNGDKLFSGNKQEAIDFVKNNYQVDSMAKGGEVNKAKELKKKLYDKIKESQDMVDELAQYYNYDSKSHNALTDTLDFLQRASSKLQIYTYNEDLKKMEHGGMMAKGGVTEKEVVESNAQMVLSQIKAVKHHADELSHIVSMKSDIEAWVVAKIERASTDLSDITHYLDGQHEKMSMGGGIYNHIHKMDKK